MAQIETAAWMASSIVSRLWRMCLRCATPVTMVAMLSYFAAILLVTNAPDGLLAHVLTFIPPSAPMVASTFLEVTLAEAGGLKTVEGQFTLKRLQFSIGAKQGSDTDTGADDVQVRFKFVLNR